MTKPILLSLFLTFMVLVSPSLSSQVLSENTSPLFQTMVFSPELEKRLAPIELAFDDDGFLWVGTTNGLYRFDGYEYQKIPLPINGNFSGNVYIRSILPLENEVWVGTIANGVYVFDKHTFEASNYQHSASDETTIASNKVNDLLLDPSGQLWLATDGGLSEFDAQTEVFRQWRSVHFPQDSLYNNIVDMELDGQGNVWVSTGKGIAKVDADKKGFFTVGHLPEALSQRDNSDLLADVIVRKLFLARDDTFWLATQKRGTFRFDPQSGVTDALPMEVPGEGKINTAIAQPTEQQIWISGAHGIELRNADTGALVKTIRPRSDSQLSLRSDTIYPMAFDDKSGLWLGVFNHGLQYVLPGALSFDYYDIQGDSLNKIFDTAVADSLLLNDDTLLVVSRVNGANTINLKTGRVETFIQSDNAPQNITGVGMFNDKRILFGTEDGEVFSYEPEIRKLNRYKAPLFQDVGFAVRKIALKNENEAVIGTDRGMFKLTLSDGVFHPYLDQSQSPMPIAVRGLLLDKKNRLWVSTTRGVGFVSAGDDQVTMLNRANGKNLSSDFVLNIVESDNGDILVNTRAGIDRAIVSDGELDFEPFHQPVIIDSGNEKHLFKASFGYWLGSDVQLNHSGEVIKQLSLKEGFVDIGFTRRIHPLADGRYLHFMTSGIMQSTERVGNHPISEAALKITNLLIDDLPHNELLAENQLSLKAGTANFSVRFALLNLTTPGSNQYRYKLAGFDKDWSYPPSEVRQAKYTSLPPGQYQLQIQAREAGKPWPKKLLSLDIEMLPFFYETLWFRVALAMLLMLAVWKAINWRITFRLAKAEEQANLTLMEKQSQMANELLEHKNQVLTSISHEFKTPLTLIAGPLERLVKNSEDPGTVSDLQLAKRNANKLTRLVEQILHLASLESKQSQNKIPINLSLLTVNISHSLDALFTQRDIELRVDVEPNMMVLLNPNVAEILVVNLLSNAAKYCNESGVVSVSLSINSPSCVLRVHDSGQSLKASDIPKIFKSFSRLEHHEGVAGSGVGLALVNEIVMDAGGSIRCEVEQGTEFIVELPLTSEQTQEPENKRLDSALAMQEVEIHSMGAVSNEELRKNRLKSRHTQSANFSGKLPLEMPSDELRTRLLIVEDNVEMQQYLLSCLEPDFECCLANDGIHGNAMAQDIIPDLIITDLMMPNQSGDKLAQAIRQNSLTCHIPIIMLTADASESSRMKAWSAEVDGFMSKPFTPEELNLRIAKLLSIRRLMAERFQQSIHIGHSIELASGQKASSHPAKTRDDMFMEKLTDIVAKNYKEQEFSVKDLSEQMSFSSRQLQRKLNAIINTTASDYIRRYRLEEGKKLLAQGLPVTQIALDVGFSSQNYFSQCFKAAYGVSPSEYQESVLD